MGGQQGQKLLGKVGQWNAVQLYCLKMGVSREHLTDKGELHVAKDRKRKGRP